MKPIEVKPATWHSRLKEYRALTDAIRTIAIDFDNSSSAPGQKEIEILATFKVCCEYAIKRINESNELYKNETAVLEND